MDKALSNSGSSDVTYEFVRNEECRVEGMAQLESIYFICARTMVQCSTPKKKKKVNTTMWDGFCSTASFNQRILGWAQKT